MDGGAETVVPYDLEPQPPADLDYHRAQDYQSLLLHCAAVKQLQQEPELADKAFATLARWRLTADPRSLALLDEWQDILTTKQWHRAVAPNERGNQIRQASPMGAVVPEATRRTILARVRALKEKR